MRLFGAVNLTDPKKRTFLMLEDKGYRDVTLNHLKLFNYVSYFIWILCLFLNLTSWLGDPISCFVDDNLKYLGHYNALMTSYCHIQTRSYQWIWMMMIVHCTVTQLPRLVWSWLEGGRLRRLLHRDSSIESISRFLYDHPSWYTKADAAYFYCCHLLCLAVAAVQILLMNLFLGGEPLQSLLAVSWPPPSVFQRITSCKMTIFGYGAEKQDISAQCVLNYNFLYEKVYLVLFLTFSLLLALSLLHVMFHAVLASSSKLRVVWMILTCNALKQSPAVTFRDIEKILSYPQFLLYSLIQNNLIDPNDICLIMSNIVSYKKDFPVERVSQSSQDQLDHRELEGLIETAV